MDSHGHTPLPQLSPSLTTSVYSSSLPSPKDIFGYQSRLSDGSSKFPPSDPPPSPPSPPSRVGKTSRTCSDIHRRVRDRTVAAQRMMIKRFHPYDPRAVASPLELRFTARSLAMSSYTRLTLDDVRKGESYFASALSTLPDSVLKKAYQSKLADRECAANRLKLTLAEIESTERHKDYLFSIKEDRAAGLSITQAQLEVLQKLMDGRNLENAEDDGGFHRAVYADDLIALSVANGQVKQVQEAMLPRPGFCTNDISDDSLNEDVEEETEEDAYEEEDDYGDDSLAELPSSEASDI